MVSQVDLLEQVQERHENGTLLYDYPHIDEFSFDLVYYTPSEPDPDGLGIDVDECVLTKIDLREGIYTPVFVKRGSLKVVEAEEVFEWEYDCYQFIIDKLTQALDMIESNLSISKCRQRQCKQQSDNDTKDTE